MKRKRTNTTEQTKSKKPKFDTLWDDQLTRQERNVYKGLKSAALSKNIPISIIRLVTELGGGFVNDCSMCKKEVFNKEYDRKNHMSCTLRRKIGFLYPPNIHRFLDMFTIYHYIAISQHKTMVCTNIQTPY